jgi:hypothetical protein
MAEIDSVVPPAWADLIEALNLLATHQNNDTSPLQCNHEMLTVHADPNAFDLDELKLLADLGFRPYENDGEAFYSYRFGSA